MRRPVPSYAAAFDKGRPIAELNMTPLIDVLLVLIVMFILLVPAITHKVSIDLPRGAPSAAPIAPHRLEVARDGAATLDGAGASDAALEQRLAALVRADSGTVLVLHADDRTRYERVDQVLAAVKRAGVTRLGFEGLREATK